MKGFFHRFRDPIGWIICGTLFPTPPMPCRAVKAWSRPENLVWARLRQSARRVMPGRLSCRMAT